MHRLYHLKPNNPASDGGIVFMHTAFFIFPNPFFEDK